MKRAIKKDYQVKKFVRQKSNNASSVVNIDFGAAATKIARVFEPGEYKLRVDSARVIEKNQNVLIALDLIELESGGRVMAARCGSMDRSLMPAV
jgi:hypothetical protein